MNKNEAAELLIIEMKKRAELAYEDFRQWVVEKRVESFLVTGMSGNDYGIEIEAHWDDGSETWIRVLGSIDDGGLLSAFLPLCSDFIISPNSTVEAEWDSAGENRRRDE